MHVILTTRQLLQATMHERAIEKFSVAASPLITSAGQKRALSRQKPPAVIGDRAIVVAKSLVRQR